MPDQGNAGEGGGTTPMTTRFRTRTDEASTVPVALLELAAERSPTPTAFFDHDGHLLRANPAWCAWTGMVEAGAEPALPPELLAHDRSHANDHADDDDTSGHVDRSSRHVLHLGGSDPMVVEVHRSAGGVVVTGIGRYTPDDPSRIAPPADGSAATAPAATPDLGDWVARIRAAGATRYAALAAHVVPGADPDGGDRPTREQVVDEQAVDRLRALLRPGDLVSAPGPGAFLVLCVIRRPDDALAVAERIRREISPDRSWAASEAVIGIAHGPTSVEPATIVAGATEARSHALRHGHRVQVASGL